MLTKKRLPRLQTIRASTSQQKVYGDKTNLCIDHNLFDTVLKRILVLLQIMEISQTLNSLLGVQVVQCIICIENRICKSYIFFSCLRHENIHFYANLENKFFDNYSSDFNSKVYSKR